MFAMFAASQRQRHLRSVFVGITFSRDSLHSPSWDTVCSHHQNQLWTHLSTSDSESRRYIQHCPHVQEKVLRNKCQYCVPSERQREYAVGTDGRSESGARGGGLGG